jgi:hypothetical protein
MVIESANPGETGEKRMLDPLPVDASLHVARDLLLAQADKTRGSRKRRLMNIEAAVLDAIGSLTRQGLTTHEWRAAVARMPAGAA